MIVKNLILLEAGSTKVYELHGTSKSASCIKCKKKVGLKEIEVDLSIKSIPKCKFCDNLVKTDVILFGEALPPQIADKAFKSAQKCDLLVMVGSSLKGDFFRFLYF